MGCYSEPVRARGIIVKYFNERLKSLLRDKLQELYIDQLCCETYIVHLPTVFLLFGFIFVFFFFFLRKG